jgi:hypothetical protein
MMTTVGLVQRAGCYGLRNSILASKGGEKPRYAHLDTSIQHRLELERSTRTPLARGSH